MKLNSENITLSVCVVRNFSTRLWSFIRCSRSPISLVSKKDMGSFSNLMKKSLTSEMFILMLMCSNIHRRMKSTDVRLTVSINCPISIR